MLSARWQQTPRRVRHMPVPSRVILSTKSAQPTRSLKSTGGTFPGLCIRSRKPLLSWVCKSNPRLFHLWRTRCRCFLCQGSVWFTDHNEARLQTIKENLLTVFDMANEDGILITSSLLTFGQIGLLTAASRVFGLLRDIAFAVFLGAGPAADAFLVALKLPNMFRRLSAEGALSNAFVPSCSPGI